MDQIKIEDLLGDHSFVRWVRFPDEESKQRWESWLQKNRHRQQDVSLAREMILRMHFKTQHPTEEKVEKALEETLAGIEHKFDPSNKNRNKSKYDVGTFKWRRYAKIAAVVLLLLTSVATVYWINQHQSFSDKQTLEKKATIIKRTNPSAVRSKIMLPDGSLVWLNAESELTYPAGFDEVREVKLRGEAYFDVVRDTHRPFIVKTQLSNIEVLGTRFNVDAYSQNLKECVSLVSGRVAISLFESDTSSLLLPGEQIVVDKKVGIGETKPFDSLEAVGWTQGWLVFKNASKDEIINKLNRWYGVNIVLLNEPSNKWNVNGYFQDQTLERVLDRLSFSKDFTYEIDDKTVKMKFK